MVIHGKALVVSGKDQDAQSGSKVKLRWIFDSFANSVQKAERGCVVFDSPGISMAEIGLRGKGTWHIRFFYRSRGDNFMYICRSGDAKGQSPVDIPYRCRISSENPVLQLEQMVGDMSDSSTCFGHLKDAPTAIWTAETMVVDLTLTFPRRSLLRQQTPEIESPTDKMIEFHKLARLTDVVLVSSDQRQIKCHRAVLAAHSDVFEALFEHDTVERRTGMCTVNDVEHETLKVLVDAMYGVDSGDYSAIADKVFVAADKYQMLPLRDKSSQLLMSSITIENAVERFVFAKENGVVGLAEKVAQFVSTYHEEFVKSGGMEKMVEEKAKQFCREFFSLLHNVSTTSTGAKRSADVAGL